MAWVDFFRISWFKLITNAVIFILLIFRFFPIAKTYCPINGVLCSNAFWVLLIFTFTKILPIIIMTYLLACLAEFLYGMFK